MKNKNSLDLVEALRGNQEKISILLGFAAIGLLGLFIYIFGTLAIFSWPTFLIYIIFNGLFVFSGSSIANKNIWFKYLLRLLAAIQEIIALTGWIWVLYLAQENPGEKYTALTNLPFYTFIFFFLFTFFSTFAGLMVCLIGIRIKCKRT